MSFQRLSFDDALAQGQLAIERDGVRLTTTQLSSMRVRDLEQNVALTLLDAPVKLFRKSYGHLADVLLKDDQRAAIKQHPEGVGYYWKGCSTGPPILPRKPCLPESQALEFLRDMYEGTLMGLNDEGKIMLD